MTAVANLVQQSSTSTGTGDITLASVNGRQTFNEAFGTGGTDAFYYFIMNRSAAEWEVGTGHLSDATTLVRDTVIESSNSNAAVNFSAGPKDVTNAASSGDVAQLVNLASTANGKGASLIGVEDSGGLIAATTVEGALAENRTAIDSIEADYLVADDAMGVRPEWYGAVGDGTTDDSAAFTSSLNAIIAAGGGALILGGKNYRIKADIAPNDIAADRCDISIIGRGPGVTTLDFSDAITEGIALNSTSTTVNQRPRISISGFSIVTSKKNAGTAISVTYADATVAHDTVNIFDVEVNQNVTRVSDDASDFGYWSNGFVMTNCRNGRITGFSATGEMDLATDSSTAVVLSGDCTGFFLSQFRVLEFTTAVAISGTTEGIYIANAETVACRGGVNYNIASGAEPVLAMINTHFNTSNYGVLANNVVNIQISNSTFYAYAGLDTGTWPDWYGVLIQGANAQQAQIIGCAFSKESGRTSDITLPIYIATGKNYRIVANNFDGLSGNNLTTAITLISGVDDVHIIGNGNEYVSNRVSYSGATNVVDLDSAATARAAFGLVIGTDVVGFGGALGTPSSGTLTNCSGLPLSGVVDSTSEALGVGTLEVGHASDTTLARASAGNLSVEGNLLYRAGGTDVPVTDGGTGRSTGTTAYCLVATGTTATGAQQTLGSGATTQLLVGGGASALPVWTTATGSGSPVRETAPTISGPTITGAPSAAGATWSNLGAVTTADINGGTIDGTTIGGASAAAGTFTTVNFSGTMAGASSSSFAPAMDITNSANDGTSPLWQFKKIRGASAAQVNDYVFWIQQLGYDGASLIECADYRVQIDSVSSGVVTAHHEWITNNGSGAGIRMTLTNPGNLKIGGTAARGTTEGTNQLVLFNGTAPVGTLTNGASMYASAGEMRVMDAAGNATTISPHNFSLIPDGPSEDMAWSFYSERDGKTINVDMLKAIRLIERLSGATLVHISTDDDA